jgi:hypothetical protein
MIAFIDDHRGAYGVEPICKVLPIAPSTYYAHAAKRADPIRWSARARRDDALIPEVQRVFEENFRVFGIATAVEIGVKDPLIRRLALVAPRPGLAWRHTLGRRVLAWS